MLHIKLKGKEKQTIIKQMFQPEPCMGRDENVKY